METNTLLFLAKVLLAGVIFGKIATLIKLPTVTGYLIGGLIIGPSVAHIISPEMIGNAHVISEIALSFIAFTIGLSFKLTYFKRVGLTPIVIALLEASLAVIFVTGILLLTGHDLAFSIVLGAIAAATAPAATLMVIKEYNARGPVTEILTSVVALDDAVALTLFGFAATIAQIIVNAGGESVNIFLSILEPFFNVFLALFIGGAVGFMMKFPLKYFKTRAQKLSLLLTFVFMASGLSTGFGVSELLACMMAGAVLSNTSNDAPAMGELAERITPPIYLMFFVLSGAELNIALLPSVGLIGLLYIIFRVAGKMSGTYIGSKITHAPQTVSRYLGMTLIPQAGVAIGLTAVAETLVPAHAAQIKTIVLCATLVYELIGPITTKIALLKAGEIKPSQPVSPKNT